VTGEIETGTGIGTIVTARETGIETEIVVATTVADTSQIEIGIATEETATEIATETETDMTVGIETRGTRRRASTSINLPNWVRSTTRHLRLLLVSSPRCTWTRNDVVW
jgi:hypothetical protein